MEPTVNLRKVLFLVALSLCCNVTLAQGKKGDGAPGACNQIADACKKAGFVKGDWKKGDGLWRDCVDPIMQGKTSAPGGTKALPSVAGNLISECKAKHPKFGGGKVGSQK
jgi:hypothetical protein